MDSDDAGAPFAGAPAGGLREAIAAALAAGDWPWPASVRSDDSFIDGLCELASAFERAGVGELALAAAVADEHAERSAIARVLLHARRVARGSSPHGPPDARARAARPLEARTLAEAFELLAGEGIEDIVMHRRIVAAIAAPPPGVRLHSHRRTAAHDVRLASIRFSDDAAPADKFGAWSAALGADVGAHDAGAGVHVRVAQPASSALAAWFDTLDAGPDVWSWPPPEEPRPLVAPAMTFSASRLNGFVKCPRRWFFEYLCDALDDEGSAAATYGKVFHEALEALHRAIRLPAEFSGNAILERLHLELDLAFQRNEAQFASRLELEVSRLRARAVAAHYARWLRAEAQDHPMHVEAVESLQRWTMGRHEFVGFVDRIDRPAGGGPITIYDYKTGRIEEDPREYVAAMRRGEEAQLALYYTVRRMRGDQVGRLALISLRDPRDPVWVLALDMTDDAGVAVVERSERSGVVRGSCTPQDIETAVETLLARADLLTGGGLEHFEVGEDPPCSYCAYARACRERPDEGERVFAR
ncbi:MAG TPA: PD-(D/E)XK nuclease family protein [Candidatus Eremiobacteraceae bacterium]|nr:PD-(D/E)XK nuclease family protein [Candidatus Eremiobacteraceae bacterium]